jgi:catechol 2,3-dioxygenase-like lactoylglutathione lyase family enzyme
MQMKLEVVTLSVTDVDRDKVFYEKLGWRLDADLVFGEDLRIVQLTPPRSECSIHIGKGLTSAKPGSAERLILAVPDITAARSELIANGVEVSEVFHRANDNPQSPGRDPQGGSYASFASFTDPDGNGWLLQEVTTRLPGREWS